ncbi:haloacid dehydrogenase-like superfamily protein [Serratia phage MTx]|uniref:Haloacid dehydrogenase-like superfamily protein n=1 Tax=Serratia phage MTx TaxID=2557553 RepID=A0A482MGX6_9CAUD|nr:polynucleotide kinase/phosphorylase [Serratia phage MTx]QBQ72380.1 haloacid dehydrogenase-like superfamily protein [Serratia phage MTx]
MQNLKGCKIAVFDMDNCIIDDRHRQHLIDMSLPLKKRYKRYHEAMVDDRPFAFGASLVRFLVRKGWKILINTARPHAYENQTLLQFDSLELPSNSIIGALMRDKEDFGVTSDELKTKKLHNFLVEHGIEGCDLLTFDDRPDVVNAYAKFFGSSARCRHMVLTGNSIIDSEDTQSMLDSVRAFKGLPFGNLALACLVNWWEKYKEDLEVRASESAMAWLWSFSSHPIEGKVHRRPWQMSDFPGAEVYNLKRAIERVKEDEKQCLKINIGKQEPFIGFDAAKGDDLTKIIRDNSTFLSGLWNIPESVLCGEPVRNVKCTCPTTYFNITSGGASHGLKYSRGCPVHGQLVDPRTAGFNCRSVTAPLKAEPKPKTAADVLAEMADTFRERNAVYKDNAAKVGEVMAVLFPDGVTLRTVADHKFYHLFELLIVKLTRFTNSGLKHEDSLHDLTVYGAMLEAIGVLNHNIQTGESEDKTR